MIARRSLLLLVPLGAMVGTACDLADGRLELPDVCVTTTDLDVQPGPVDASGMGSFTRSFVQDRAAELDELLGDYLEVQARFKTATLRLQDGSADLSFVNALQLVARSVDPGLGLPDLVVARCEADECAPEVDRMVLPASATTDAAAYLRGGAVEFDLSLTGRLPAAPVVLTVEVCFDVAAEFHYHP
jgi:hypothetical protein